MFVKSQVCWKKEFIPPFLGVKWSVLTDLRYVEATVQNQNEDVIFGRDPGVLFGSKRTSPNHSHYPTPARGLLVWWEGVRPRSGDSGDVWKVGKLVLWRVLWQWPVHNILGQLQLWNYNLSYVMILVFCDIIVKFDYQRNERLGYNMRIYSFYRTVI